MKIKNVFSNTYGLARSLLAVSTLITISFTNPHYYFNEVFFKVGQPQNTIIPNFFYLFGEAQLGLAIMVASFILFWVISGYLPQITGILHAWVVYSFFTGSIIIEGGDQLIQIIAILLVPITLFDKRINHWSKKEFLSYKRPKFISYFCYSIIVIIQVQMAALYLFAGSEKLAVPEWSSGSAFYYWFNHVPFGATDMVKNLFSGIINNHFLSPLVTWGVILLEVMLFAALFMTAKKRKQLFFFGIFFHFMIVVVHGLASFFLAMAAGLILYLLPPDGINFKKYWAFVKKPIFFFTRKVKSIQKPAYLILIFIVSGQFSACDQNDDAPQMASPLVSESLDYLKDSYYWEDLIPQSVAASSYETPEALLSMIKSYSPMNSRIGIPADRWSFVIDNEAWLETLNGNSNDFGLGMRFITENELRISWVQPDSPAGNLDLTRGKIVSRLNNIEPSFQKIAELIEILAKESQITLEIKGDENESDRIVVLEKTAYTFNPVLKHAIYEDANNRKTGYLNILSFTGNTKEKFDRIFQEFNTEQIERIIIDLRYNGGGLLSSIQDLAGYLVPASHINDVFYKVKYNKNYSSFDENIFFNINSGRIDLDHITFIVGPSTASSSEILINALQPYIPVDVIGLPTNGKFFGMQPKTIDNITLVAVSFATLNSTQETIDVSYQIIPDIELPDDLTTDFLPMEENIAAALGTQVASKTLNSYHSYETLDLTKNRSNTIGSFLLPIAIKN